MQKISIIHLIHLHYFARLNYGCLSKTSLSFTSPPVLILSNHFVGFTLMLTTLMGACFLIWSMLLHNGTQYDMRLAQLCGILPQ